MITLNEQVQAVQFQQHQFVYYSNNTSNLIWFDNKSNWAR